MALPTKQQLFSFEFSLDGTPFVNVTANDSINTNNLDWSLDGTPFWAGGINDTGITIKIFHGELPVSVLYVGSTQITKVYLGGTYIQ